VIPLAPPSDDLVFSTVSSSFSEYTISLGSENISEFHTGRVVHIYDVKREWPLFTSEGNVTVTSDFSDDSESWSAVISSEDIHYSWNLLGGWTASWEQHTLLGGNRAHIDMTIIEVTDTYIHAIGRVWSTTHRTDWLAYPTFEIDFDERLTRLDSHQTAIMWDENAGIWNDGDSNHSYLISIPVHYQRYSEQRTQTVNISFFHNGAHVMQRGIDTSHTLTRTSD